MDGHYMVKQYVGEARSQWSGFRVFKTQFEGWLLFCQMDWHGCDTGLHIPVEKKNLSDKAKQQLGMKPVRVRL